MAQGSTCFQEVQSRLEGHSWEAVTRYGARTWAWDAGTGDLGVCDRRMENLLVRKMRNEMETRVTQGPIYFRFESWLRRLQLRPPPRPP